MSGGNVPDPPLFGWGKFRDRVPRRDFPKPSRPPWILIVGVLIAVGLLAYLATHTPY